MSVHPQTLTGTSRCKIMSELNTVATEKAGSGGPGGPVPVPDQAPCCLRQEVPGLRKKQVPGSTVPPHVHPPQPGCFVQSVQQASLLLMPLITGTTRLSLPVWLATNVHCGAALLLAPGLVPALAVALALATSAAATLASMRATMVCCCVRSGAAGAPLAPRPAEDCRMFQGG